jgi:pimeloyl-ACP methyl ester carboxylesterase
MQNVIRTLLALSLFVNQPLYVWSQVTRALTADQEAARGIVIVIGGVGGLDLLSNNAHVVLPKAGVKHEIREFCWTHGKGKPFKDLQDSANLKAKAEELAEFIRRVKAENPGRIIILLAKSGGTGVALAAAELLPANMLERIILLSAAVSPTYDLRRALQATRAEIVSFHSPYDQFILNFGTRQFGTIDRVYGPSAGLRGFRLPATNQLSESDRALYRRVVQVPWSSRMLLELNNGSHLGTSLPGFLAAEVAPWLR